VTLKKLKKCGKVAVLHINRRRRRSAGLVPTLTLDCVL